jgi:hypothetical protein
MERSTQFRRRAGAAGAVAALVAALPAQGIEFSYSGYIREHLSVNLQNAPELGPVRSEGEFFGGGSRRTPGDFEPLGGKGELSMARTTLKLDGLLDLGFAQVVGVGRVVREHHTEYERRLQKSANANPAPLFDGGMALFPDLVGPGPLGLIIPPGGFKVGSTEGATWAGEIARDGLSPAAAAGLIGSIGNIPNDFRRVAATDYSLHGGNFFDQYDSEELREIFAQFDIGPRNHFRLGRQQVVWGETDFFRAMDIIHGYDLRWRLFLELENEELRKPLILANYSRDISQIDGALQIIYRPGWDAGDDIGNQLPLSGGRWSPQPIRGFDALALSPYNFHHCSGDEDDPNYGARLAGVTKQINWSLNYYRNQSADPVISRNPRIGGTPGIGCFEGPIGTGQRLIANDGVAGNPGTPENAGSNQTALGQPAETVFPMVDTFGITANLYAGGWLDGVLKTEVAFIPNQPYNAGKNTWVDLPYFLVGHDDGDNDGSDDIPAGNQTNLAGVPVRNDVLFGADKKVMYDTTYDPKGPKGSPLGCALCIYFPGLREIEEKPTLKIMLGMDKQLYWTPKTLLKTQRPATWLVQLFDTWVLNYDKDDELLELPGFGATRREHTTYLTNALLLNYKYDTINPGIAHGVDLGNFDQFILPFIDLVYGDHWRIHGEASLFFAKHTNESIGNNADRDTRLLGSLVNHDQATVRITYQF